MGDKRSLPCGHGEWPSGLSGGHSGSVLIRCEACGRAWRPNDSWTERPHPEEPSDDLSSTPRPSRAALLLLEYLRYRAKTERRLADEGDRGEASGEERPRPPSPGI